MGNGVLFVVSAPSGAGKSTLIEQIRPFFPDMLYSISCTTRTPRGSEINGVHYYFVGRDEFFAMVERGEFLEWKEVHTNLYGTPAAPVMEALAQGRRMILDIDVYGAFEVFKRIPESVGIFVAVGDISVLEARLRQRGLDSEESLRIRLRNSPGEMRLGEGFTYQIVNDVLETAVQELVAIIRKESDLRGMPCRSQGDAT
ncbi:MAG: guanylate kinase [Deltaproteobacteria bacterium]|nr:guanylate kinase [Deltaproteobacteria bacterium]